MQKTFEENKKKFLKMEESLKKDESDLLAKKNVLSKEDYGKKMNALRKTNLDYQKKRRESIDKITILRSNARESLLEKIIPIVEAYTKENDISLVVDKKYILGGNPEIDITKLIVEKLNKELPSLNLQ